MLIKNLEDLKLDLKYICYCKAVGYRLFKIYGKT